MTLVSLVSHLTNNNAEMTAWFVMRGILHGLTFLHMRGIVHGSVAPNTIRIRPGETRAIPYLVGYGLDCPVNHENDIYAWAITFAWLVLGGDHQEMWAQRVTQLSSRLLSVLARCLTENPQERPAALELLQDENLKDYLMPGMSLIPGKDEQVIEEYEEGKKGVLTKEAGEMHSLLRSVPRDGASKAKDRAGASFDRNALCSCVIEEHQRRQQQQPLPAPLPAAPTAAQSKNPHGLFSGRQIAEELREAEKLGMD